MATESKRDRHGGQLGYLAIGGPGGPRPVVEDLPGTKGGVELVVGRKFVESLRIAHGRSLTDLRRPDDQWPDLVAREGADDDWYIELSEVVHPPHAAQEVAERRYESAAMKTVGQVSLPGVTAQVMSSVGLPRLGTSEATAIVQGVADVIIEIAKSPNPISERLLGLRSVPHVHLWIVQTRGVDRPLMISFGSGYSLPADDARDLLRAAIEAKVNKCYASGSYRTLLLLYVRLFPVGLRSEELVVAREFMAGHADAFDEVWLCHPMPGPGSSSVIRLWPDR